VKLPPRIIERFEASLDGLEYGDVSLVVHLKKGIPRVEIKRDESFLLSDKEAQRLGTAGESCKIVSKCVAGDRHEW